MEIKTEVKTIRLQQYCDDCKYEEMVCTRVLLSYPEQYVHQCPKCKREKTLSKRYPCIEYEATDYDTSYDPGS